MPAIALSPERAKAGCLFYTLKNVGDGLRWASLVKEYSHIINVSFSFLSNSSKYRYVYILKSLKDGKYYIGSTSDTRKRLNYHNSGKQRSTKYRIPFILVYQEEWPDNKQAERREKQIKSYKGGQAFMKLISGV